MKKNKLDKIFKPKSFLFIFNIILVIGILFMFSSWLGVKLTYNKEKLLGPIDQPSTVQTGNITYDESGSIPTITKKNGNDIVDEFKILTTSDLHFHDTNTPLTLGVLEAFIDKEKPDLVVLDGDMTLWFQDRTYPEKMIEMFEEKQQYWTFVLGNHDDLRSSGMDKWEARRKSFEILSGYEKYGHIANHCLARNADGDLSKIGSGTNCINIQGSNGLLQSLFFIDCDTVREKNDYVLDWFDNKIEEIKKINNGILPEIIVYDHMPFYEFPKYARLIGKDDDIQYEYGKLNEVVSIWTNQSNGLLDKLTNLDTKVTCVFGHDHVNNLCYKYKNVRLMYTLALPYNSYNTRFLFPGSWVFNCAYALDNSLCEYLDGVTDFIVKGNQDTTICPKYAQLEHVLDNYQGWLYLQTWFAITYNGYPLSITLYALLPIVFSGNIVYTIFAIKYNKKQAKKVN